MATSTSDHDQQDAGGGGGEQFTPGEKRTFPLLVVYGVALGVVTIVAVWAVLGGDYGIPLLILLVVLAVAAVGFRLISGRNRDPADSGQGGLPTTQPDASRPLGDTAEAHDEINHHDFPLYSPGRRAAERMSGGAGGTTRGHDEGGATGRGGPTEGEGGLVGADEAGGADLGTRGV